MHKIRLAVFSFFRSPNSPKLSSTSRRIPPPSTSLKQRFLPLLRFTFAIAIASLPLAVAVAIASSVAPAHAARRPQFEYTCMNRSVDVTRHLNILGRKGWELVAASSAPPVPTTLQSLSQTPSDEALARASRDVENIAKELGVSHLLRDKLPGAKPNAVDRERGVTSSVRLDALFAALRPAAPLMVWCLKRPR